MRNIDPRLARVARRGTSRAINRQIVLNLVRTHEPISRADIARMTKLRRGVVGLLINELIADGRVFEGAKGQTRRGRRPQFLYIDSRHRYVIAIDVRVTRTFLMVSDLVGRPPQEIVSFATPREPRELVRQLGRRITAIVAEQGRRRCEGVGVAFPGMIEETTRRVLHAPTLGWSNVILREPLVAATGLPVFVENSGRACVLAQMWGSRGEPGEDIVFVTVSDGVGVGAVVNGDLLRGRHNAAAEFGHMLLSVDGPRCSCGASGCWEAYVSNLATLSRYFGRDVGRGRPLPREARSFTVDDLIARARGGDAKALLTLQSTARYLGLGLASILHALDPARIFLSGEITGAWDLLEPIVRSAVAERALNPAGGEAELTVVPPQDHSRLRGAAALVAMPTFAASAIA